MKPLLVFTCHESCTLFLEVFRAPKSIMTPVLLRRAKPISGRFALQKDPDLLSGPLESQRDRSHAKFCSRSMIQLYVTQFTSHLSILNGEPQTRNVPLKMSQKVSKCNHHHNPSSQSLHRLLFRRCKDLPGSSSISTSRQSHVIVIYHFHCQDHDVKHSRPSLVRW